MAELGIVQSWDGGCWWGSKKRYPSKAAFLVAIGMEMYPEEETCPDDAPRSEADVTETRLRHCVGGWCGENGEPHWHPTGKARGAPAWQYGKEE